MNRRSGDLDSAIELLDSRGARLAYQNLGGSGKDAAVKDFRISRTGNYTIRATRYQGRGSGEYALALRGGPPPTLTPATTATPAPASAPLPTAAPAPASQPTEIPTPDFTSSSDLLSRYGIRVRAVRQHELLYPANGEITSASLKALTVRNALYYNLESGSLEACFPDGTGLFFHEYGDNSSQRRRIAPLAKYQADNLTCVQVSDWFGTIVRVDATDAAYRLLESQTGDYRQLLISRISRGMPNPLALARVAAACLAGDLYNRFITGPSGQFSYAFSSVLYNDAKAIYAAVDEHVSQVAQDLVDFLVEETQVINILADEFADNATEYVLEQMDEHDIEIPGEEQVQEWVQESLHALEVTKEFALDVVEKVHIGALGLRVGNAFVRQAQHLPKGLSLTQKAVELVKAPLKAVWRDTFHHFYRQPVDIAKKVGSKVADTALKTGKVIKAKAILIKNFTVALTVKLKALVLVAAASPAVAGAKVVAAAAIFAVIARGTTGAIHDIISGKHDAFFEQRQREAREVRDNCFSLASSELRSLSEERRQVVLNNIRELMATYGIDA